MKVNTNTALIGLLGLIVVGGGAYLIMRDRRPPADAPMQDKAAVATDELAAALNVKSDQQFEQMYGMMMQALQKSGGDMDKALRDQQLIAGYVDLGISSATQIANAIGSLATAFG